MKNNLGFTLIEVLVALVILTCTLTTAFFSLSQQIKNFNYLQDKTFALWVGDYILKEMRVGLRSLQDSSGTMNMLNKKWRWYATFFPSTNPPIKEVKISVSDQKQKVEIK